MELDIRLDDHPNRVNMANSLLFLSFSLLKFSQTLCCRSIEIYFFFKISKVHFSLLSATSTLRSPRLNSRFLGAPNFGIQTHGVDFERWRVIDIASNCCQRFRRLQWWKCSALSIRQCVFRKFFNLLTNGGIRFADSGEFTSSILVCVRCWRCRMLFDLSPSLSQQSCLPSNSSACVPQI